MIRKKTPLYKKTERLVIRPLQKEDYENWMQAYSSLHPAKNEWDEGPWKSSELTKAKFNTLLKEQSRLRAQDEFYDLGIFRQDDGLLIGHLSLMDISRKIFQNAYIGYRIFNPFWDQGYAGEACRALIDIAFRQLHLHRIEAAITQRNRKSVRVARAMGLRYEGLSRRRLLVDGEWKDFQIFATTAEDHGIRWKK